MITLIAHEISTPLSAILGYTELILDSKPVDESTRESVGIVYSEAERCKTMLDEILMFSRQREPRLANTLLRQTIADVLRVMRFDLVKQTVNVSVNGPDYEIEVLADQDLLKQVLVNLIKNACHAMKDQKEKKLEIGLDCQGRLAQVTIRDHGPGVPLDVIKGITDMVPLPENAPPEKNGLGLVITSQIVREHNGHLSAYNAATGGGVFCVELPNARPLGEKIFKHAA